LGAVEIQGSLHGLNLRVGSGDLLGHLDGVVRRVGRGCASIIDDWFGGDGGDIISLERICEGFEAENVEI